MGSRPLLKLFLKGKIMDENCEPCEGQAMITQARTVSLAEKLTERQKDIEQKLSDVKRAKEILAKNPDLEELLTILDRTGRHLL